MSSIREQLAAEFTNGEVQQFTGRGGKVFDYIEDETVMDRLDAVLGVGGWSIQVEPISAADGIVKVSLAADINGVSVTHQDFGYASNSNPDAELLKEAVSDGIRRCGRYLGIGRYLYKKHATRQNGSPARPTLVQNNDPYPDELLDGLEDDATCPEHGVAWIGSFGDRYHKKPEGGYCRTAAGNVQKPARVR